MFKTLHSKLLLFFLLITILPMLAVGIISYHSQKEALTKQIEEILTVFSESLAVEIEDLIAERIADVQLLAGNPVLRNPESTAEEIRKELQYVLDIYDIYYGAIFVSKDGVVTVDMDDTVVGNNLSDRDWFQASIQGKVFFSDIYLSSVVHNPMLVLAEAVRDQDDQIIGVVSPSFNLNYLWRTIDRRFTNQRQNAGFSGYAFLINKEGNIIAHPDRSKVLNENYLETNELSIELLQELSSKHAYFWSPKFDTVNSFAYINPYPSFDHEWYVGVSVPRNELQKPLKNLLVTYIVLFGVVLLITSIAVVKLSKYIVEPVQRLVAATADFALGKKIGDLGTDAYDEINQLNQTFEAMTTKLEEREKAHKKSTLILETTDNGVLAINKASLTITTFNKKCEELFSISKELVLGRSLKELEQHADFKKFIDYSGLLLFLSSNQGSDHQEFECMIKGLTRSFLVSISTLPMIENEEKVEDVLMVFSDISEKRFMEKSLIRSEKLKTVGQVAAGLAHEIRNPLTTIRGFMQLFNERYKEADGEEKYYKILIEEIDRVNSIVNDLLHLANPNTTKNRSQVEISKVLDEIVLLHESQVKLKNIHIAKQYGVVPLVYIDTKQIKQVFLNIVQNAFESMSSGGLLTLSTKYLEQEKAVQIRFTDTGCGMDHQTIENLGTPFYTTKETGTGLGMMTSFRIIEEMEGTLHVESEVDKGTIFTIKLPVSEEKGPKGS